MDCCASSLLIGVDFSNGKDIGVLIVGKQISGKVEIINAFQGKEAYELYEKLIARNNKGE